MTPESRVYHLFEGIGLELEYMIVSKETYKVCSLSDFVLQRLSPDQCIENEVVIRDIGVSNELAMHVIELKTMAPVTDLIDVSNKIKHVLSTINTLLDEKNCCLMPGGTHPFMNPLEEGKRWPYGNQEIYDTYHKIFNTNGHGWFNLQSVHLNFPFDGDHEFVQLHDTIRVLLPLISSLCASSPIMDSRIADNLCQRLAVYEKNQARIPEISGAVVPEKVNSIEQYKENILAPMYKAIAPLDTDHLLQEEWLNSRGAIARFDRNAIEIRVCDIQENCVMDMAIARWVEQVLKFLVTRMQSHKILFENIRQTDLVSIYRNTVKTGIDTVLPDAYVELFGGAGSKNIKDLILYVNTHIHYPSDLIDNFNVILDKGSLAKRMLKFINNDVSHDKLKKLCSHLADCLATGVVFDFES